MSGAGETGPVLAKPGLYGNFGNFERGSVFLRRQRQRLNLMSICWCLFVPWVSFCACHAACSFKIHYTQPWLSWTVVFSFVLLTIYTGMCSFVSLSEKVTHGARWHQPTWYLFLFITMLVAVSIGTILGNQNFYTFMQKYYDYVALNEYNYVNVATTKGAQVMDASRISFINGTTLDLRKAMGFKNLKTYCVAPITTTSANMVRTELGNYDFWAVGLDCCSGDVTDYHCGQYNNPAAKGGLRLLADTERSFYRLAVQQAEAVHHIHANHPLFFYWVEDPSE